MNPNRLYDFEIQELILIHASLVATTQLAQQDESAPIGLLDTALNTVRKITEVIELRCNEYAEFNSLANSSLNDLDNELDQLENTIKNETEK